jgi:NADPH:quinone reductase
MKAVWYQKNGPAQDVLTLGDLPMPAPAEGEVLVKVHFCGVNPSDVKSRAGRPLAFDRIVPHSDASGIIEAVGSGVDAARIGQRVWIWNGQWQRGMGTCAQFIALPQQQAVVLPNDVDLEAGACLGIPALTAWQAVSLAQDISGKTVLVIGAANAVGAYAVQMAKRAGATVIGTVGSEEKAQLARELGADATINYKTEALTQRIKDLTNGHGVDVVIDMDFSTMDTLVTQGAIKPHGLIVCYGSNDMGAVPISFKTWLYLSITVKFFLVYDLNATQRAQAVDGLNELLASGYLKHVIGPTYPLEQTADAHMAVEQGRHIGNVLVAL